MQANKFLGFFIASVLVIFSFACEHKKNTSSSAQNKIFTDSISFWLEKSNAPNPLHYSKNLQKALTAVHLETNDSLKLNYSLTLSLIYMNRRDSINFWNSNNLGMSLAVKRNDSSNIADAHWDVV